MGYYRFELDYGIARLPGTLERIEVSGSEACFPKLFRRSASGHFDRSEVTQQTGEVGAFEAGPPQRQPSATLGAVFHTRTLVRPKGTSKW